MENLGTLLFENSNKFKVYGLVMGDLSSFKVSVCFYIVAPNGEISQPIHVSRKDIFIQKSTWSDIFFGMYGFFSQDDVLEIKNEAYKLIANEDNIIFTQRKATVSELYQELSDYIRKNAVMGTTGDAIDPLAFIKNDFGHIRTPQLEKFLKNNDLGYSSHECIEALYLMGVLIPSETRKDMLYTYNKQKLRCYKIKLASPILTNDTDLL